MIWPIIKSMVLCTLIGLLILNITCKNADTQGLDKPEAIQTEPEKLQEDKVEPTEDWVDMQQFIPSLTLDIRYATNHNFVGEVLYDCGKCYLTIEAAQALKAVVDELSKQKLKIKVFDCYRPHAVQKALWKKIPDARYVTPPDKGSMHNRGLAVDLTLLDADNQELDMGTAYDYFGKEAYHDYTNHSKEILNNRKILKSIMAKHGFKHIRTEWWHYSLGGVSRPVSDWEWWCG